MEEYTAFPFFSISLWMGLIGLVTWKMFIVIDSYIGINKCVKKKKKNLFPSTSSKAK